MGLESANVAGSIAKSLEVERSPGATSRASQVSQEQIASESVAGLGHKKADAAEHVSRARDRQERERRRHELERMKPHRNSEDSDTDDGDTVLDVVV